MMKNFTDTILNWSATSRVFAYPRSIVKNIIRATISRKHGVLLFYDDPERSKVMRMIKIIKSEREMLLGDNEAYQIFMAVRSTEKVPGDIAEVGTYKGASAKLICEAKGVKPLHLFDTFEGLPDLSSADDPAQFHRGQFSVSFNEVSEYLHEYRNVHLYKGLFPSTAGAVTGSTFSFVHLDLDLYEATLEGIKFFYPRMSKGGIIISHDYTIAPGVRKAFNDYFQDKPEPIIEMSGSQCLIVKT
jgi:O-methyltransferase